MLLSIELSLRLDLGFVGSFSLFGVDSLELHDLLLLLSKGLCFLGQQLFLLLLHHDALGLIVFVAHLHHVLVGCPGILQFLEERLLFLSNFVVLIVYLVLEKLQLVYVLEGRLGEG